MPLMAAWQDRENEAIIPESKVLSCLQYMNTEHTARPGPATSSARELTTKTPSRQGKRIPEINEAIRAGTELPDVIASLALG
jgi:hypothetical protein